MCSETNALGVKKEIMNEEFWLSSWDTVVVKVGSNVLAWSDNWVNLKNIENIVNEISYLMEIWLNVFLVSSWAVAIWKNIENAEYRRNEDESKIAFYSTIWQSKLIEFYFNLFNKKNIKVSQNLLTHNDFEEERRLKHLKNVWKHNTQNWVLAIINENDAISKEELWFSDNDKLAWLVAKAINAKVLILLSDINWIYKNFWKNNEELIETISDTSKIESEIVKKLELSNWTWWAKSKLDVMQEMMNIWVTWILSNWWEENIIQKIFSWKNCNKTIFRV